VPDRFAPIALTSRRHFSLDSRMLAISIFFQEFSYIAQTGFQQT
jgi:hypothetical protein